MSERMDEIFYEVFEPLPRQGPGSLACAQRALAGCRGVPSTPTILDLGCGAGAQTLHLARLTDGTILALDRHPPLIERLADALREHTLTDRVEARVADMSALDLEPGSFDLVWSEGALYNLGLERALPMCADLLRPGGTLVFTDAVWRSEHPPEEVREAFADYPTMGTSADVLSLL
ncbi:MAG: class I SAM-dependent methyltransferase, partial [Deltaproteobacteria bacterium]|nr:class I SAM-dependent methyltransferase [Deltaproteobacteria bacterium]